MTEHGDLLRRYLAAFACGQLDVVAGLLPDDVAWELNGVPQTACAADLLARQAADIGHDSHCRGLLRTARRAASLRSRRSAANPGPPPSSALRDEAPDAARDGPDIERHALAAGTPGTEVQAVYVNEDGAAIVGISTFIDRGRSTTPRSWACEAISVREGRIARICTLLTPCR